MTTRFYCGNIPYQIDETEIRAFFAPFPVTSVRIVTDRDTGRPRGFAFVDVDTADVEKVISALNGQGMGGRSVIVSEAHQKKDNGRSNGGGNGNRRNDRRDRYKDEW